VTEIQTDTHTSTPSPDEIERDIEATREQLGDTVEALAYKTDVKARAKQQLARMKTSVIGKKQQLQGAAKSASPEGTASMAVETTQKAKEHPIPLAAVGGFAAGVLTARMLFRRS
jgi:hypothetical protein